LLDENKGPGDLAEKRATTNDDETMKIRTTAARDEKAENAKHLTRRWLSDNTQAT